MFHIASRPHRNILERKYLINNPPDSRVTRVEVLPFNTANFAMMLVLVSLAEVVLCSSEDPVDHHESVMHAILDTSH